MNSRLVDLSGTMLFNRIWSRSRSASLFLGLTLWRFSMTERAPSKRAAAQAGQARSARARWRPSRLCSMAARRRARRRPSRLGPVHDRAPRVEIRQVLTSPGLIVLLPARDRQHRRTLWLGQSTYGTPTIRRLPHRQQRSAAAYPSSC